MLCLGNSLLFWT